MWFWCPHTIKLEQLTRAGEALPLSMQQRHENEMRKAQSPGRAAPSHHTAQCPATWERADGTRISWILPGLMAGLWSTSLDGDLLQMCTRTTFSIKQPRAAWLCPKHPTKELSLLLCPISIPQILPRNNLIPQKGMVQFAIVLFGKFLFILLIFIILHTWSFQCLTALERRNHERTSSRKKEEWDTIFALKGLTGMCTFFQGHKNLKMTFFTLNSVKKSKQCFQRVMPLSGLPTRPGWQVQSSSFTLEPHLHLGQINDLFQCLGF